MLMNYVVRIKNVKVDRLKTIINYLNNDTHKNHTKKNTEIYELSDRELYKSISNDKIVKNKMEYVKNKKGGRPLKVFGKSLTFNIPVDFDFDLEKSKVIYEDLIKELIKLYESYNVKLREEEIYSVLHKQDNSHYHILIPYLDSNGNTIRDTKTTRFLNELKLIWNEIMINHYNTNLEDYQPQSKEEVEIGKNTRYLLDLKGVYDTRLNQSEDKYLRNQVKVIDRLLKLNEEELENNNKLDTVQDNYRKAKGFYKTLGDIKPPSR